MPGPAPQMFDLGRVQVTQRWPASTSQQHQQILAHCVPTGTALPLHSLHEVLRSSCSWQAREHASGALTTVVLAAEGAARD